jgi:hypothetical protein
MLGDDGSISMGVEDASLVLPHLADAEFSIGNDAVMVAKKTVNLLLFQFLVKEGFPEHTFCPFNDGIISDSFMDRKASDFLGMREPAERFTGFRKKRRLRWERGLEKKALLARDKEGP